MTMLSSDRKPIWHCWMKGSEHGPFTAAELKAQADSGTLREHHLVWKTGTKERIQARFVQGLFDPVPIAPKSASVDREIPKETSDSSARDVFISYSSHDKPTADAICATLERDRIRCWIAPRDVFPGIAYGEAIVDAITVSRLMVVVFSNASNGSPQVLREVERAVSKGIPIVPFRIDDVRPTKSLEYFLSAPHWLDALTKPLEDHIRRLSAVVRAILDPGRSTGSSHEVPRPRYIDLPSPAPESRSVLRRLWTAIRGGPRNSRDVV